MGHDDHGLEQQGYGPHAQQTLEDHDAEEQIRQPRGLRRIRAIAPGQAREHQTDKTQRRGEIAMDHFPPGLASLERPVGIGCLGGARLADVRNDELTVASRPIGTAEPGIRQAHPGADRHDEECQCHANACERQKSLPHLLVNRIAGTSLQPAARCPAGGSYG
jgi:hypothetical protein